MKVILAILVNIALIFLFSNCSNNADPVAEKEQYEKVKESLEEKERRNPVLFLTVTSKDKHNLIGQTVVKGVVQNKASVFVYRDVLLEIAFYSKTGTLLEKGNETVYDEIAPGKAAEFKIKNFAPKGTDSIAIKVLGAKTN